jgi:hypothetical protein
MAEKRRLFFVHAGDHPRPTIVIQPQQRGLRDRDGSA